MTSRLDNYINPIDGVAGQAEVLAGVLLEISQDMSVPQGDRHAAKVAHNRMNVAVFEMRHLLEALAGRSREPEPAVDGNGQAQLL